MTPITKTVYECDHCGRSFTRRNDCLTHEREVHKCPVCRHAVYTGPYLENRDCKLKRCNFRPDKQG